MSCAVAVAGSPVFSPSLTIQDSPRYLRTSSSPETLTLNLNHHYQVTASPLRRVLSVREDNQKHSLLNTDKPCSISPSSSSPSLSPAVKIVQKQGGFRVLQKKVLVLGEEIGNTGDPASAILKRKRPARLDIPLCTSFSPLVLESGPNEVDFDGDRFSVYCKKGRRDVMEDCYSALVDLLGDPKQAFFAVFDGHGGRKAAEFASANMDRNIMDEVTRRGGQGIEEAVRKGYLMTDSGFLKEEGRGGTCCVTALIRNGDLVVSNAGDCRAVMSRRGTAQPLTSDHRPSRKDERERIESLGGYVDCFRGVWRLHGSLAVSRGIGDSHLKQWVSAEPETKILRITPECEFLILASDGLWDKVSNQEAVDMARPFCVTAENPSPISACKKLVDLSVTRGSVDDISVMIIQLGRFM